MSVKRAHHALWPREEAVRGEPPWPIAQFYFPVASLWKCPKLRGLKQPEFILSLFWRLEVQSQGVRRTLWCLKILGEHLCLFLASGVSGLLGISSTDFCFCCPWWSSCVSVALCFQLFSSHKARIRATLIQYEFILTSLHLPRPYFQMSLHLHVLGV